MFVCGSSLTFGQLIRALSRLPQGKAFEFLVLSLSCQIIKGEANEEQGFVISGVNFTSVRIPVTVFINIQ